MRRVAPVVPIVLAAAVTLAHGVSPRIAGVESAAEDAQARFSADAAKVRSAARMAALLHRKANEKSLAAEIGAVAQAARLFETKLAGDAALAAAFRTAADGYRADLLAARANLALAAASASLPPKARKRAEAALARFDRAFPPAGAGKVPTPLADELSGDAAAAVAAAGTTPYDAGTVLTWVMSDVSLAPSQEGLDLDGDGTPDNELGTLQALLGGALDVDAMVAAALASDGTVVVLEMSYVKSLAKPDPFVLAGLLSATGDATSGYSADPATLAPDGLAALRAATALGRGGAYRIEFGGQEIPLAGLTLPATAKAVVQGVATETSNTGLLALGIPIATLATIAEQSGTALTPQQIALLSFAADLDLDPAVPGKDALSAAFAFAAAAAPVAR